MGGSSIYDEKLCENNFPAAGRVKTRRIEGMNVMKKLPIEFLFVEDHRVEERFAIGEDKFIKTGGDADGLT